MDKFLSSFPAPPGFENSQLGGGGNFGRSLNGGGRSGSAWILRAVSAVVLCIWMLEMAVVAGLFALIFGSVTHGGGVGAFSFCLNKVDRFDFGSAWGFLAGFLDGGWVLTCMWEMFVVGKEAFRCEAGEIIVLAVRE